MARAGIALGSNLGDRLGNLHAARAAVCDTIATAGEPRLAAAVYQTAPRFCPDGSPDFFNTVIEIDFDGEPHDLLTQTRAIESQLGRTRGAVANAPRVIDLDLLYLGGVICRDARLTLPHPRLAERRFVLEPLAAIRPDLILPGRSQPVCELLAALSSDEPQLQIVAPDW